MGQQVKLEEAWNWFMGREVLGWERSEIGRGWNGFMGREVSLMGGSSSEMGLWKEEYTPTSDWGCLPRGFLTWALRQHRTDVGLPCGFLWWAWNYLKAQALARVRWWGRRKKNWVNAVFICYSTFSWVTVPVLKKYHPHFFFYLLQCFQFSAK